jgi:hypothetical protein
MRKGDGAAGVTAETGTAEIISAAQAAPASILIFTLDLSENRALPPKST